MAGELITADFQFEYNGLLLGAGTPYEAQEIDHLTDMADVRSGTVERFGRHGGVPGRHYLGPRDLTAKFDIWSGSPDLATFKVLRDAVKEAFAIRTDPSDMLPFVYKLPSTELRQIDCRPTDYKVPLDRDFALGYGQLSIRLECADPFVYSNTLHSVTASKGTTSGGFAFPAVFPLVFGTISGSSSGSVVNLGNAPAYWVARISGAVDNPVITHLESGRQLEFDNLTISAGDELIIDSKERSIMLNGTASRRGNLAFGSRWFDLVVGNNTIGFSADSTPTGFLTFEWRDQYWSE